MGRAVIFFAIILLLMTPGWAIAADSADLAEIRQYFELRDTISLVNLEMKRALSSDSKSPMLSDRRAENDLAAVLNFLEERIAQFASVKTPLKYHYVKKLGGLFNESRQLQAALLVKLRAHALAVEPGSTIDPPKSTEDLAEDLKTHPRPYFQPIDLRALFSPSLTNANKMQFPVASLTASAPVSIDNTIRQSQKSPFPVKIPQKTPVLSEPVKIIAPPTEQTVEAKSPVAVVASVTAGVPEKPVPSTEKLIKPEIVPVKSPAAKVAASATVTLPADVSVPVASKPALVANSPAAVKTETLPKLPSTEVASLSAVTAPKASPEPATATPVISTGIETASATKPVVTAASKVMRPLAVMIENHNKSRPQSGLDQADLVYEMPVEGGITRFMAIYTRLPGLLGPVRSCREYFIDRALEVDALYVHCGASPVGYAYISKSKINSVDEIKHSKPFFRDNSRKAPHNLYGRGKSIFDYMSEKVSMYLPAAPRLINYGKYPGAPTEVGESVKIRYHGNYTLEFKFENGVYQRYMNNVLHVDRESQKPLQAAAVVVQVASMQVVDKAGRQEISFIGKGRAWVLENGKKTAVTWSKKKPRELTSYKDAEGREYLFPKGLPIWVQVVSPAHKLTFNGIENTTPVAGKETVDAASATAETGKQG